jgi:adenylate cyclase
VQGRLWLRFARHDPGLYISAKDLLEGNIDPARLADRFIFLGTSAIGLHDVKATPLDRAIPGVEVHAIMLDSLFAGALLAQPDWAEGAELILTVAVGLFLVLLGPRLGSTGLGVAVVLACTAAWALSWTAYDGHGVLLDPALPTMAWIYAGTAVGFANYRREERQREAVRASFSRYVSPALVERLADDPTALRLGGELRELSILFCDIRGFTTMSERLDAKSLIALMNRYFTPMAGAVLDHRGMVDKYIGDAIMALWNAPLADPEHAANAARAALEMRRRLAQLNGELALEATGSGEAQIELRIGIGISTGPCAVGNIGTDQRLEYSALGDPVNLAARLESQSMRYGYDILLSEATQAGLSGFALIELDTIIVKGKSQPIRVYALVGDERTALLPAFIRLQSFHSELLQTYRDRQWAEAREIANECRRLAGEFGLRRVYKKFLQRIDVDEQRQVPENWGGIHIADRK